MVKIARSFLTHMASDQGVSSNFSNHPYPSAQRVTTMAADTALLDLGEAALASSSRKWAALGCYRVNHRKAWNSCPSLTPAHKIYHILHMHTQLEGRAYLFYKLLVPSVQCLLLLNPLHILENKIEMQA